MFEFLSLREDAFGLDVSDFSIKIAKLKRTGDYFDLLSFNDFPVKRDIMCNGEIKDEKGLAKVIVEALSKVRGAKIKTKYVVASLPEERSFLRVIEMPDMDMNDLSNAIRYEVESYIPLPINKVYFDFKVIKPMCKSKNGLNVLITAMPREIIDSYIKVLRMAGLRPLALEVEAQSVARALIKGGVSLSRVLFLNLGSNRTGFDIFAGRDLRFTCSISTCGRTIDEVISKALKVDLQTAEKLKIEYGLSIKNKKEGKHNVHERKRRDQISKAMIPVLLNLAKQIKKYIDYYLTYAMSEHLPPDGKGVEKVFLCGGNAYIKGIDKFLSQELKVKVEIGDPWVNTLDMSNTNVQTLVLENPAKYTTALGLALRAVHGK